MVNAIHQLADKAAADAQAGLFDKVELVTFSLQDEDISTNELHYCKLEALEASRRYEARMEYYEARQYERLYKAYDAEIERRTGQIGLF